MKITDITAEMKVVRNLTDAIYEAADNATQTAIDNLDLDEFNCEDEEVDLPTYDQDVERLGDHLLALAATGLPPEPDPNSEPVTAEIADALFAMNDATFNQVVHAAMTRRARNDGRGGIDQWQVGDNANGSIWAVQPASDIYGEDL